MTSFRRIRCADVSETAMFEDFGAYSVIPLS